MITTDKKLYNIAYDIIEDGITDWIFAVIDETEAAHMWQCLFSDVLWANLHGRNFDIYYLLEEFKLFLQTKGRETITCIKGRKQDITAIKHNYNRNVWQARHIHLLYLYKCEAYRETEALKASNCTNDFRHRGNAWTIPVIEPVMVLATLIKAS